MGEDEEDLTETLRWYAILARRMHNSNPKGLHDRIAAAHEMKQDGGFKAFKIIGKQND